MESTTHEAGKYWSNLQQELHNEINLIVKEHPEPLAFADQCMGACIGKLALLKAHIQAYQFFNHEEEIHFFKLIKPAIHHLLIFYNRIYTIELAKPAGSHHKLMDYFNKEILKVDLYFEEQADIYLYYISQATDRDHHFFMRNYPNKWLHYADNRHLDRDPTFCTLLDFDFAQIMAYTKLVRYLQERMAQIDHPATPLTSIRPEKARLQWKGKRVDFGELMYALWADGVLGFTEFKAFADAMQATFEVNVGNGWKLLEEIRLRKKDTLPYLKHLIDITEQQMIKDNDRSK